MAIQSQNPPKTSERTIDKFKSRLTGGIARPNLFEVVLAFPNGVVDESVSDIDPKTRFLVKAAALPASNIAPISVPFRGRQLKIAGDRTFDEWTITVINDTDFAIRGSFERWMNSMSKVSDNAGNINPEDYTKDAFCSPGIVEIRDGEVIALYNEVPEGATMVKKDISKEAFERWTLKAKEKWNKDKSD